MTRIDDLFDELDQASTFDARHPDATPAEKRFWRNRTEQLRKVIDARILSRPAGPAPQPFFTVPRPPAKKAAPKAPRMPRKTTRPTMTSPTPIDTAIPPAGNEIATLVGWEYDDEAATPGWQARIERPSTGITTHTFSTLDRLNAAVAAAGVQR